MSFVSPDAVVEILAEAGGRIVGRTRLQKAVCALELTGLGYGFSFNYRHFGPYSEELKLACDYADAKGLICEERKTATWGGEYSAFVTSAKPKEGGDNAKNRETLLGIVVAADPVALELAVTAAFLASKGVVAPWGEVAERKRAKATARAMSDAKDLYKKMQSVNSPKPLHDMTGSSLVPSN